MRAWREIAALPVATRPLFAATLVTRLGTFVLPYLAIYLTEERGLGVARTGAILGIGSLGLLFGNAISGWLLDRWSRRGTLATALLVNAVGYAGLAVSFDQPALYTFALLVGLTGVGMVTPAAQTLLADVTAPEERTLAYTVYYLCVNVGMAAGPLLGGSIALAAGSATALFLGDVLTTLVGLALVLRFVPAVPLPSRARAESDDRTDERSGVDRRRLTLAFGFALSGFFFAAPLMGLEFAVPLLVRQVLEGPALWVGVVYAVNGVTILVLGVPLGRYARGRDEIGVLQIAGAFWLAGLALFTWRLTPATLLIGTAIWTIGEVLASVSLPSWLSREAPVEWRGRVLAVQDATVSVARIASPVGLGWVWAMAGPDTVLRSLLALPIAAVIGYGAVRVLGSGTTQRGAAARRAVA